MNWPNRQIRQKPSELKRFWSDKAIKHLNLPCWSNKVISLPKCWIWSDEGISFDKHTKPPITKRPKLKTTHNKMVYAEIGQAQNVPKHKTIQAQNDQSRNNTSHKTSHVTKRPKFSRKIVNILNFIAFLVVGLLVMVILQWDIFRVSREKKYRVIIVPHSKSGVVPMSSLLGVG